jgi:hypothetical protein
MEWKLHFELAITKKLPVLNWGAFPNHDCLGEGNHVPSADQPVFSFSRKFPDTEDPHMVRLDSLHLLHCQTAIFHS